MPEHSRDRGRAGGSANRTLATGATESPERRVTLGAETRPPGAGLERDVCPDAEAVTSWYDAHTQAVEREFLPAVGLGQGPYSKTH